jgi:hypothetical protein
MSELEEEEIDISIGAETETEEFDEYNTPPGTPPDNEDLTPPSPPDIEPITDWVEPPRAVEPIISLKEMAAKGVLRMSKVRRAKTLKKMEEEKQAAQEEEKRKKKKEKVTVYEERMVPLLELIDPDIQKRFFGEIPKIKRIVPVTKKEVYEPEREQKLKEIHKELEAIRAQRLLDEAGFWESPRPFKRPAKKKTETKIKIIGERLPEMYFPKKEERQKFLTEPERARERVTMKMYHSQTVPDDMREIVRNLYYLPPFSKNAPEPIRDKEEYIAENRREWLYVKHFSKLIASVDAEKIRDNAFRDASANLPSVPQLLMDLNNLFDDQNFMNHTTEEMRERLLAKNITVFGNFVFIRIDQLQKDYFVPIGRLPKEYEHPVSFRGVLKGGDFAIFISAVVREYLEKIFGERYEAYYKTLFDAAMQTNFAKSWPPQRRMLNSTARYCPTLKGCTLTLLTVIIPNSSCTKKRGR